MLGDVLGCLGNLVWNIQAAGVDTLDPIDDIGFLGLQRHGLIYTRSLGISTPTSQHEQAATAAVRDKTSKHLGVLPQILLGCGALNHVRCLVGARVGAGTRRWCRRRLLGGAGCRGL
jgi:hypothetical protein